MLGRPPKPYTHFALFADGFSSFYQEDFTLTFSNCRESTMTVNLKQIQALPWLSKRNNSQENVNGM
jgi:hypothetical protein